MILAGMAAIPLGVAMLALGWPDAGPSAPHQWVKGGEWHIVEGRVIESRVEGMNPPDTGLIYSPVIGYVYTVDGRRYRDERTHPAGPMLSPDRAAVERFVAEWPPGRAVTVRYDARDPRRNMPLAGADRRPAFALIALGMLLGAIGWLLRRGRPPAAA